jgi:rhamnose utilization protein RhaD (predicted bifunctional aldolase and dehydrogenase)
MKKRLSELVAIAGACAGEDLVQGSGGNLSVKLSGEMMLIKASGFRFSELRPERGFVVLRCGDIRERYGKISEPDRRDGEKNEADFLLSCRCGGEILRPSMEAGFHAFLGEYVLHTHSVYANTLNCTVSGEDIIRKIFAASELKAEFLPYFHPGAELAIAVRKLVQGVGIPDVIFLQNHGMIVSASSAEKVLSAHTEANDRIRSFLGLKAYFAAKTGFVEATAGDTRYAEEALFPDQVIFDNGADVSSDFGREILGARAYILSAIKEIGAEPRFLSAEAVVYLRNMETEKHRKTMQI